MPPQFHIYFDEMFEPIWEIASIPSSQWQMNTGLSANNQATVLGHKHDDLSRNNRPCNLKEGSEQGTPDHALKIAITETDSEGAEVEQQQAPAAEHNDHDSFEYTEGEDTGYQSMDTEVSNNEPMANEPER